MSVIKICFLVGPSGIDNNGSRQTEVVNKQEAFLPPTLQLSAYLERMSWDQDQGPGSSAWEDVIDKVHRNL